MKTALALIALMSLSASSLAIAAGDVETVFLRCRDARLELRDAGTTIEVRSGGFAGVTFARVSETTIGGSVLVGDVVVREVFFRCGGNLDHDGMRCIGGPKLYQGKDFELAVFTTVTPLKNGMLSAHFRARVNGHDFDQQMACSLGQAE